MAASGREGLVWPIPGSSATVQPIRPSARGVQSIEIGGRLLAALVRSRQPMMLRDLANEAGLTPGQAHAYLVSFRKLEIVEQDAATGRYQLGPFALHLGLARQRSTDAVRLATAAAPALSEKTGLMTVVTVWGSGGATVVYVEEAANQILINVKPGITYSIVGTATGKVFAAFLPPKIVEPAIARELDNLNLMQRAGGPVDAATLEAEVAAVRASGYAATIDTPIPGLTAISAPVFDFTNRIQLAVTLVGPSQFLDARPAGAALVALLQAAGILSAQLGYIASSEVANSE
jgi:DNA-binding IclR family transcriptional regulator